MFSKKAWTASEKQKPCHIMGSYLVLLFLHCVAVCKCSTSRYGLRASQRAGNDFWLQVWDVRSCEILLWGSWDTGMFPRDIPIPLGSHTENPQSPEHFDHWSSLMKVQLREFLSPQSCAMFIPGHSVLWCCCLFHRTAASLSAPTLSPAAWNGSVQKSPVLGYPKALCADRRRAAEHLERHKPHLSISLQLRKVWLAYLWYASVVHLSSLQESFQIFLLLSLLVILDSSALYYREGESQLYCNADIYIWHMCVYIFVHIRRELCSKYCNWKIAAARNSQNIGWAVGTHV